MKRLLLIIILFLLTSNAYGYFEINDGVVTFYSDDGARSWSMQPSLSATTVDWIWPDILGNVGQAITSDGTETLSWGAGIPSSLTDGGILIGQGTDQIIALGVAANGQIPIGDGATDPVLATITGNLGIDVTNGAGSITLDFDSTEISDTTWGSGTDFGWTFDIGAGTNPALNFSDSMFGFTGAVAILNGSELRFNDTGDSDYVGFEAPALTATQIWVLPAADGDPGGVLTTDGLGDLSWTDNASEKTWAFMSRDASSGTNYIGGFYKFGATDNDFNPSITFGTANVSYAAHVFLVQAAGASAGVDTVIRVTGTTINDQGTRATAVDVDITVDDAGAAGTYYETTEKWLGQVAIAKQSGPDLLCNYGFTKYWDNNNTDYRIVGIEATWLGAKNDATPDIQLLHHKPTGWTYNAASAPTPPAEIASMATDHNTEIQIAAAQEGAWKRDNLSEDVMGSTNEGTIIELATTTNRTYAIGNFLVRIVPQPPAVVLTDKVLLETGDVILLETGDGMLLES